MGKQNKSIKQQTVKVIKNLIQQSRFSSKKRKRNKKKMFAQRATVAASRAFNRRMMSTVYNTPAPGVRYQKILEKLGYLIKVLGLSSVSSLVLSFSVLVSVPTSYSITKMFELPQLQDVLISEIGKCSFNT